MSQGSFSRFSGGQTGGKAKRRYTVQLSLSAIITSGIVLIIGLGWVFAFGVIVGRGYNPESKMPGLATLVPPASNATVPAPEILKPEELTFMNDLKQRPTLNVAQPAAPAPSAVKPGQTPPAAVAAAPAGGNAVPAPDAKTVYDFVFQVVAYKNSGQADTLRERLEGKGLRTRMTIERDSGGKARWYRVQVLLRGTEADAARAKEILGSMGLKDIVQASRKATEKNR